VIPKERECIERDGMGRVVERRRGGGCYYVEWSGPELEANWWENYTWQGILHKLQKLALLATL
jgi:hypothetical protein